MINEEQQAYVYGYLKSVKVTQQEIHDELYDHIVTSYENELTKNSGLDIETYIREEIQPAFGGLSGIKKMVNVQNHKVSRYYRKAWIKHLKYFLQWPTIVLTVSVYLILFKSLELWEPKKVTIMALGGSSMLPLLVVIYGFIRFYIDCKMQKRPYSSSLKNTMLTTYALLFGGVPNLMNTFLSDVETFTLPSVVTMVLAVILTGYLILAFSYLRLLKEDFDFKLAFS